MTDDLSILVDLCNDIQQRSNFPSVDPHAYRTESLVYITKVIHTDNLFKSETFNLSVVICIHRGFELSPFLYIKGGCITTKQVCRLFNVVSSAIHYPHGQWE
jgi:hypothetical protein